MQESVSVSPSALKMNNNLFFYSNLIWFYFSGAGVFYCGAPVLAKEISKLCYDFNQKGSTKFEFHKEHF